MDGGNVDMRESVHEADDEIFAEIDRATADAEFGRDYPGRRFKLVAENPAYDPIVTDQCQILGKVILSIRQF